MNLRLDKTQEEVLNLISQGKNRKEISGILNISYPKLTKIINLAMYVNNLSMYELMYYYGHNSNNVDKGHLYKVKRVEVIDERVNERVFEAVNCNVYASVNRSLLTITLKNN